MAYAPDAESRHLYEEEAAQIAEIQKGILAISHNEKPYDVFICYKETDEAGQRTHDSQWAQEVYYGLTEQGYKVFFSRITLEDKLGQEYEPYIFAALQSARVMVVIGSKPEYFNSVWVKNEWSRYLALMDKDRKRLLIPCYRGMDPYDLPDELSSLQSQDMSKIGFMQDLIRGIRKVLDDDQKSEQPRVNQQVAQNVAQDAAAPGVTSLMQRAYLFLEDGDFNSAAEYLDRVLDIDPKFAPAYAAKVCVTFGIRKEADLAEVTFQYEVNLDWQKAMRFADLQQKAVFEDYAVKVKERVALQMRDYAYDCAMELAVIASASKEQLDMELIAYKDSCTRSIGKRADGKRRLNSLENENTFNQAVKTNEPGNVTESDLKTAAVMFDTIGDEEAAERAKQCRQLADQARQKAIYQTAVSLCSGSQHSLSELEEAAKLFLTVPDYQDAKVQAQACVDEVETIRTRLYNDALSAMHEAGDESRKWDYAKKLLAKTELSGYRDVEQLRTKAARRYEESVAAEQAAKLQAEERIRREEEKTAAKKKRNTFIGIFAATLVVVAILVVTQVIIPGSKYRKAVALQQAGKYEEAIIAFEELYGYGDSEVQIEACQNSMKERDYQAAVSFQQAGKYEEAITAFTALGSYSDAATQIIETKYLHAKALTAAGDYEGAVRIFSGIEGYKDVDSLLVNDHDLSVVAEAREAKYTVGNYVTFGHYPQTSGGNDSTEIEWVVLARDGNKALLLSRYGLDVQLFSTVSLLGTWEYCTLRSWLNGTFLNKAFTLKEQMGILLTNVDNGSSQGYYSTSGGNNTEDKVFLLSYAEANKYLGVTHDEENTKSRIAPTVYALEQGAYTVYALQGAYTVIRYKTEEDSMAGEWWLRSPGMYYGTASIVGVNGCVTSYNVEYEGACVRPALWINLESEMF